MKKFALWSGVIWIIIFVGIGVYGLRQRSSYHKALALYQAYQVARSMYDYKYTKVSFLEAVREKYPAYENWEDDLFVALLKKRPVYKNQIAPDSDVSKKQIWEEIQTKDWYKKMLSLGETPEKIKEYIFNPVIVPKKPSYEYGNRKSLEEIFGRKPSKNWAF